MGRFSSVDLYKTGKSNCDKCGMANKKGCCNSKLTIVKLTDNQQASTASLHLSAPFEIDIKQNLFLFSKTVTRSPKAQFVDTSPPPFSGAFRCIVNSVFII